MIKKIIILLALFQIFNSAYSWRNYSRFPVGSDSSGIGGASVADASSETSAVINPSGLSQNIYPDMDTNRSFSFSYEAFSGVRILDPLAWDIRVQFDTFPFLGLVWQNPSLSAAISVSTVFYAPEDLNPLTVKSVQFSGSKELLPGLSIGAGIGPIIAYESSGYGFSWFWQTGILWKISDQVQFGAHLNGPFSVDWTVPATGASLSETFPLTAETGFAFRASESTDLFAELEYTGIDGIRYIQDKIDLSPKFGNRLSERLHPRFGVRFLESFTGAHISFGISQDSYYYDGGSVDQYLLSAGLRAYGKNTIFRASIIDALLIGLFYSGNVREEKLSVSFGVKI